MNLFPFIGFYERQHETIRSMLNPDKRGLKLSLDLLHANIPIIKQFWPELNKNGLLDDFLATLDQASYSDLTQGVEDVDK